MWPSLSASPKTGLIPPLDLAIRTGRKIAALQVPVNSRIPESAQAAGERLMVYGELAEIFAEKKDMDGVRRTIDQGLNKIRALGGLESDSMRDLQVQLLRRAASIYEEHSQPEKKAEYLEKALSLIK